MAQLLFPLFRSRRAETVLGDAWPPQVIPE